MTVEEILAGETNDVEFKEDIPIKSDKYVKTVIAFTNGSGGRIVFGVEDNSWKVKGFSKEEVFRKMDAVTNAIYDSCEPKVMPSVKVQEFDNKYVIIVDVARGMQRPYYIKSQGIMEGTYIRVSGTTRRAAKYDIQEMILDSGNRSYDQEKTDRELTDKEIDALCDRLYDHACELCQTEESKKNMKRISKNQLISYKLILEEGEKCYATHGYQLLDGKVEEYPDAVIQCAVFKGTIRDIFITRKEFKGCIDEEIESAYTFVLEHINMGARMDGLSREDIYELPIRTIREMISNAVCHRSYLMPGKVQVALFDDRLEVTSPGMLDYDLTLEKLRKGQSKIRNKGIAEVFSYMNVIEAWGSGIPRMYKEAASYGLPEPELIDLDSDFRVNLFRKQPELDLHGVINPKKSATDATKSATDATESATDATKLMIALDVGLSAEEKMLLTVLKSNPSLTQKQLHEMTAISLGTIKRLLPKLQEKGILKRIGSRRSGQWRVL